MSSCCDFVHDMKICVSLIVVWIFHISATFVAKTILGLKFDVYDTYQVHFSDYFPPLTLTCVIVHTLLSCVLLFLEIYYDGLWSKSIVCYYIIGVVVGTVLKCI